MHWLQNMGQTAKLHARWKAGLFRTIIASLSLAPPSYSASWGSVERDRLPALTLPGGIECGRSMLAASHGWLIVLLFPVETGPTARSPGRLGPELSTSKRHNGC